MKDKPKSLLSIIYAQAAKVRELERLILKRDQGELVTGWKIVTGYPNFGFPPIEPPT